MTREEAIDILVNATFSDEWQGNEDLTTAYHMAIEALLEQTRWIPCSERLPEEKDAGILKKLGTDKKSELVLATVEVKGERMTVTACTHDGKWEWNMKYAFPDFKVVAWMPLPKPYVEEVVKQGETE